MSEWQWGFVIGVTVDTWVQILVSGYLEEEPTMIEPKPLTTAERAVLTDKGKRIHDVVRLEDAPSA